MFGVPRLRGFPPRFAGGCRLKARAPNFSKHLIVYAYLLTNLQ